MSLFVLADGDLYITIAEIVQSDLVVQTWGRQKGRSPSYCEPEHRKVYNIETINTDISSWKSSCDHSKWCVARDQNNHWMCIADVNRAQTQFERYGGALCLNNEIVKNIFQHFVLRSADCTTQNNMDSDTDCEPDQGVLKRFIYGLNTGYFLGLP